ncbi:MAG: DUF502 domain-containing protein [Planctomycetota bacterium]
MSREGHTFGSDFRVFFLRGLAILLPSIVTLALLAWAYGFLKDKVAEPINAGVRTVVIWGGPRVIGESNMPAWYRISDEEIEQARATIRPRPGPEVDLTPRLRSENFEQVWREHWYLQGIGFVVALVLVYLAGVLVGNYLGRKVYARVEGWLVRFPVIKQVYPNVKQVTDFLLGGNEGKRKLPTGRVVLVEYPRRGIWTVGLMTGETLRSIQEIAGAPCVTIFIPSSPTPFTGYTITVPADEVWELPISMDEAIRFVVSGGVLVPPSQAVEETPRIRRAGTDLAAGPAGAMMSKHGRPDESGE